MQDVAETTGTLELEVERGPMAGQRLSLVGDLRVGSAEEGAATLNDPWLSAAQALFHRSTDGWAVEDLRSVEGTRVNGRPVRGAVTLAVGDRVEFGSTRIAVLPNGTATLEDLPEGRAEATAGRLADENRRKLDARRLGAALLDGALLIPLLWLMREYGGHTKVAAVAAIAVQLTYYFLCESLGGQTLGKRVAGLRVVRRDGCPLKPQH